MLHRVTPLLLLLFLTSPASAVVIEYSEVGSDVFFTWSGQWFEPVSTNPPNTVSAYPAYGNQGSNPTFYGSDNFDHYNNTTNLVASSGSFWSVPFTGNNAAATGDTLFFRWNPNQSRLDHWNADLDADGELTGTMTIFNETVSSLGLIDWWLNDSNGNRLITIQQANVPAPATALVMLVGLMFLVLKKTRFQKRS